MTMQFGRSRRVACQSYSAGVYDPGIAVSRTLDDPGIAFSRNSMESGITDLVRNRDVQ
jgi:hypothetical protein